MEWTWFLVLMLGVGLGSAAAAWATRRPETVVRVRDQAIVFEGNPTPEQVESWRAWWEMMAESATDPYTAPVDSPPVP